ncbi:MAG: hypothetical protein LAQ30_31760, partial [Acidobacteriia bacterium]|nr:hypothetical protein [Terriglobia bacterium]
VPTARLASEADVRAAVDKVVKDGADSIAEVHYPEKVWPYNPTAQETKNLAAASGRNDVAGQLRAFGLQIHGRDARRTASPSRLFITPLAGHGIGGHRDKPCDKQCYTYKKQLFGHSTRCGVTVPRDVTPEPHFQVNS